MNILFTSPSAQKIRRGTKTMTARCWKRKPPKIAETVYAKNYARFALIKIVDVWEWSGDLMAPSVTREIAKKNGFDSVEDFFIAYYSSLNARILGDTDRRHWFIEFEVIHEITYVPSP